MSAVPHRLADVGWRRRSRVQRRRLLEWYRHAGRRLPWRATRDPYAVLVSELMSQQTQVGRVVPAWTAFLGRFPTVEALARAPTAEVVAAWRGLGYNRRAVNLQRAAGLVVAEHDGRVPEDVATLERLPGVGPYTARAVAVFAHGRAVGPVDTNVARVLSRAVAGRALGRRDAQRLADCLVYRSAPDVWSHALMDLGAAHCTARRPVCASCPLASTCAWRLAGCRPPDPAVGGAHAPKAQGRLAGSDRWHRGRIVDALREGPVAGGDLARAARLAGDPERLERVVASLLADGLAARRQDGGLELPHEVASGGGG